MNDDDFSILFAAFCLALCTYGMVMLLRAAKAWRARAKPKSQEKVESRRRLTVATAIGAFATLLGGGLASLVAATFNDGGAIASYRMAFALMLLGVGIACVIVGYRWDRAKGRRRCPRCWYSYEGLAETAACPECGRVGKSERDLLRTRRKPALYGVLPLMMIAAWISFVSPVAKSWRSYIPTTVMIAGYEWMPEYVMLDTGSGSEDCFEDRLKHQELARWQVQWAARRAARTLMNTQDQARGADACRHIETLLEQGARLDLSDAARCALRLAPKGKAHVPNFEQNHLFVFAVRHLTVRSPLDPSDISILLAWHQKGGRAAAWSSVLIMRMAPATSDVIGALVDGATSSTFGDGQQASAIALGQMTKGTPELVDELRTRFRSLDGDPQFALGIAITSSYLTAPKLDDAQLERARLAEVNGRRFAELLRSEDPEVVRCALQFSNGNMGIEIDPTDAIAIVSQLAASNESLRWSGIGWLYRNNAITDNDVPTLIAFLDANPDSPYFIGAICRTYARTEAWLPFKSRFERHLEKLDKSEGGA